MNHNILILHTGGTFGMVVGDANAPEKQALQLLENLLQSLPELAALANIHLKVLCNIDSSDASAWLWELLARTIYEHWDQFHGFVIIHGTDTLAWTATALAFFLEGLTKPVVVTGSQRPLSALRNDARMNMIDAVELATSGIPEVMVCFDSQVHRAARVTKYSNEHLYAYKSYNAPLLGRFGVNIKIRRALLKSVLPMAKRHPPHLNTLVNSHITTLACVPGALPSSPFIQAVLQESQGIIVQGFGSGNLPIVQRNWLELFEKALEKKIPVVLSSQCDSGEVSLTLYENGRSFFSVGAVSAGDMTFEATSVKLMVFLGRQIPFQNRHEFFATPLAFECAVSSFQNEKK